jgi:hypothetical protein
VAEAAGIVSGVDYTVVENAIAAWVRGGSGLPASRVLWAEDDIEQLELAAATPWISMNMPGLRRVGQDWRDKDLSPAPVTPGEEITYRIRGNRVLVLTLTCFNAAPHGAARAAAILDNCIADLASPSRARALAGAGVGFGVVGDVQPMSKVRGFAAWEPRASVQLQVYVAYEKVEKGTNVRTVQLTGGLPTTTAPDVELTVTVTAADP